MTITVDVGPHLLDVLEVALAIAGAFWGSYVVKGALRAWRDRG